MSGQSFLNLAAVTVALIAVLTSSFLAWQAIRVNQNMSHMPVVLEVLKPHRSPEFVRKEIAVWEELPSTILSSASSICPNPCAAMLRTWDCIEAHVAGERALRGAENTFLNAYQEFARRTRSLDIDAATQRLVRRSGKLMLR